MRAPRIAFAISLIIVAGCTPESPQPIPSAFQCVAPSTPGHCAQGTAGDPKFCRVLATSTEVDEARGCRGLRWDFPAAAGARLTTGSNTGDIYRIKVPPGLPGDRHGALFDEARIERVESADMTQELGHMRRVYGMHRRGESIATFEVFEADPSYPDRRMEVALVPTTGSDYFLRCTATSTSGPGRLIGACMVAMQLRPLAQIRFYIDSDDVSRVHEINERLRAAVGDWIATPAEEDPRGFARVSIHSAGRTRMLELCFSKSVNHGLLDHELRLTFADAKELGRKSVAKPGEERLALISVYSDESRKQEAMTFTSRKGREVEVEGFRVFVPDIWPLPISAFQNDGLMLVTLYPSRLDSPQWTLEHQVRPLLQFVERSVAQCTQPSMTGAR